MKQYFELVIVIPIGPGTDPLFVIDTVESIRHYTRSSYRLIFIDDSHSGIGAVVSASYPEADLIFTAKNNGRWAGLYLTLAQAFRHAIEHYSFAALWKIDTDALVIGAAPESAAVALFKNQPQVGMAGQYGIQYDGQPWDISWPYARIISGTTTWRYIKRPVANWFLRKIYLKALKNGYQTGESVFGGTYFFSEACLQRLLEENYLPETRMGSLSLEEDHIFSLLVKAVGYELADLSAGDLPLGCTWRGLPAHPEELFNKGKKIIHSTRYWNDMKEQEIRAYFQQQRSVAPVLQDL